MYDSLIELENLQFKSQPSSSRKSR